MKAFVYATRVARFLPISVVRWLAGVGALIAWVLHGRAIETLEGNLARVTGTGGRELRRLSRQAVASTARYYVEVIELARISGAAIDARVRMVEDPRVRALLDGPETHIVVLAHAGNWDLVGAYTCRNLKLVTAVAEVLRPQWVFEEFVDIRARHGLTVIGNEGSRTFRDLMTAAREPGKIIALVADRDLSGSGVVVEMWGQQVRVAPGPAALSVASGCALIPVNVHYERLRGARRRAAKSKWGTVMSFGQVVDVPGGGSSKDKVAAMTQEWATAIADGISQHPADWHMMQRFGWVS